MARSWSERRGPVLRQVQLPVSSKKNPAAQLLVPVVFKKERELWVPAERKPPTKYNPGNDDMYWIFYTKLACAVFSTEHTSVCGF